MKEISISIIYEAETESDMLHQIKIAQSKYVPSNMDVTDIAFEREWLGKKSKITFKGVEQ